MKTIIAIPCLDQTSTLFDQCLDNLNPVGQISKTRSAGSLVYVSRNNLSALAVKEDVDYVLWLDSDMVFSPDLLERLMADMDEEHDIVAPIMFRRKAPFSPVIYKHIRFGLFGDNEVEEYHDYPRNELFEVDAVGFGCVLMKTKVLKDIIEAEKTVFMPYPGFGEDLSACLRAKKLGYKIYCDSRIKIGHISQTVVTEETWDEYRAFHKETDNG